LAELTSELPGPLTKLRVFFTCLSKDLLPNFSLDTKNGNMHKLTMISWSYLFIWDKRLFQPDMWCSILCYLKISDHSTAQEILTSNVVTIVSRLLHSATNASHSFSIVLERESLAYTTLKRKLHTEVPIHLQYGPLLPFLIPIIPWICRHFHDRSQYGLQAMTVACCSMTLQLHQQRFLTGKR